MTSEDLLKDFLVTSPEYFPADKYALIMWDHGFGSRGYGYDNISRNSFSLETLQNALSMAKKETQIQFELIGFDACLMATYGVADKMTHFANFLVASQEDEPGSGWQYTKIISSLNENSTPSGNELGKDIVDSFYASTVSSKRQNYDPSKVATLSVLDLSKFDDVKIAYDEFENTLLDLEDDQLSMLSEALDNTERYGKNAKKDSGHVDLKGFSKFLENNGDSEIKSKANSLSSAIDTAVVYKKNGESKKNSNGLSFYFPRTNLELSLESTGPPTRGSTDALLGLEETNNRLVEFYLEYLDSDTTAPEFNVSLDDHIIKGNYTDRDIFEINFYFTSKTDNVNVAEIWSTFEWHPDETNFGKLDFEWDGYKSSLCNSTYCYPLNAEWEWSKTNTFAYVPVLVYSSNLEEKPVEGSLVYDIVDDNNAELIGFFPEPAKNDLFSKQILPLNDGSVVQVLATYLNLKNQTLSYEPVKRLKVDSDFNFDWTVYDWGPIDIYTEICDFSGNCKISDDVFTLEPIEFAVTSIDDIIPLDQNDPLNPDDYEYPYDYEYFDYAYEWQEYDENYEIITTDLFCTQLHNDFDATLGYEKIENICQHIKNDFGFDIDVYTINDIIDDIQEHAEKEHSDPISIDEVCIELHNEFDEEFSWDDVENFCKSTELEFGSGGGQFGLPRGIAVDNAGNIFVAEFNNNRIQKFDSDGDFLLVFGSPGSDNGQFNGPSVVAVDDLGNIYVADTGNHRIQKFDSDGNFLLTFGSLGSDRGQLYFPQDIAVDSIGNIYVADTFNHRIQKFDSDGNFLLKLDSAITEIDPQAYDRILDFFIDYVESK
jgi:hypothetical protein